ncbi:hypothetical protein CEXT_511861 [Caerostris extrusa]|uniref:Uncharacterized protein n=1 Tax=Caerostris extrusa TaxID=172846 RepID=A0AAV4YG38_CAEEX|nr:hypothetical protein CEXT_511861 [Caerostris extrusa]
MVTLTRVARNNGYSNSRVARSNGYSDSRVAGNNGYSDAKEAGRHINYVADLSDRKVQVRNNEVAVANNNPTNIQSEYSAPYTYEDVPPTFVNRDIRYDSRYGVQNIVLPADKIKGFPEGFGILNYGIPTTRGTIRVESSRFID